MKSNLATFTHLTKNHSGKRTSTVKHIVIHHMAGIMTAKQCADYFATTSRQVSSNYTIGYNGDIACSVLEDNRAWTTASNRVDQKSITIEVSNSSYGGQWPVSNASMDALIRLIADICKRHGIKQCTYTGNENGTLLMHKWYANTNCPGPYLSARFGYIAEEVNKLLNPPKPTTTIKVGDKIRVKKTATHYATGQKMASFVKGSTYTASQVKSDRVLAKEIVSWVKLSDIEGISTAQQNPSQSFKVGSKVKIKTSATLYATGQKIPSWVKGRTDTVLQIKTDRVLLKGIYSWVYRKDIEIL